MKLYFAYGSNMSDQQMADRCPESHKRGIAFLQDYRWIITTRGYASVIPSPGDVVEGILFAISPTDEATLDRWEGVQSNCYYKATLSVRIGDSCEEALVYIDFIEEEGTAEEGYITRINRGLADAQLSPNYIESQIRPFIPATSK